MDTPALIGGVIVGAAVAFVIAQATVRRQVAEEREIRARERAEADRAIARHARQIQELELRVREQSEVFQILPDLVRQMFQGSGRDVFAVTVKLLEKLFAPERAAVFIASEATRKLRLAEGQGLPASLTRETEIEFGQGPIGYVAEHRLALDENDFGNLSQIARRQVEAGAMRDFRVDAVAPAEAQGVLKAVVAVGGARLRVGQEKRLVRMVAELTAQAFVYVHDLRTKEDEATRDGLTSTFNKRYLTTRLAEEFLRATQKNVPLSLCILDIDHFKHYNDTNGHLEGDEVLKTVAKILKGAVREDDVVARYGGEEFVVVLPRASKALAYKQAQTIRRAIESHPFPHAARQPLGRISISGGVASYPEDAQSALELMRAADQALYEAKAEGRNRIKYAAPNYLT